MVTTSLRSCVRFALLLAGSAPFLLSQQSSQSPAQKPEVNNLVFRSIVNRVILDVVVTDSQGKPVRGLDRRDFSVTEDGVPQRILSFDLRDLDTASESLPPNLPPLPLNTFLNLPKAPEKGPLYVLLLDLVNTEIPDQMWARQQLLKFIKEKPEGTRFAVFLLSDGLHLVQGFTSDKELLYAAVDSSHPRHHVPRVFLYARNYGLGNRGLMVSVFQDLARYLDGLPGRKNIMWLAGMFPLSLYTPAGDAYDFSDEVKEIIDLLAREQAAVYTLNAAGVGSGVGSSAEGYIDVSNLTGATGGKGYFDNDLKTELADATEDGANYYTLSYAPSNTNYNGKLRNIGVSLAKHGYQLSYRRSYYADDPSAPVVRKVSAKDEPQPEPPRRPGDSLIANMEYGAPMAHQLVFRAHLQAVGAAALGTPAQMANLADQPAYFQVRRKNRPVKPLKPIQLQTYVVDYTVLLPAKPDSGRPLALEFATAAFDGDGTMLNGVVENGVRIPSVDPRLARVQGGDGLARQNDSQKGIYRAQQRIDVPVGATTIRVAVRDMTTDRIGALEVNLPLAAEPQTEASQTQASQTQASAPQSSSPLPVKPN